MKKKGYTEQELLEHLEAESAHADELAILLPQELTPFERLKGSVVSYKHHLIRYGTTALIPTSALMSRNLCRCFNRPW